MRCVEEWLDLKQTLIGHCDRIGRDPSEITCSVNVRIDPALGIEPAVSLATAIMNLPHVDFSPP